RARRPVRPRSQGPPWERKAPKLRFIGRTPAEPGVLPPARRPAKQSFGAVRSQGGPWERGGARGTQSFILGRGFCMSTTPLSTLSAKDLARDQEVRWCPGCGDYSILAQMKTALAGIGVAREKMVFISGIGCSSRFPYYMNTYGFHTIHGRAPTFAT